MMTIRNRSRRRSHRRGRGRSWNRSRVQRLVFAGCFAAAVAGFGQPRSEWSILLDSRTFVPRPGIEEGLLKQSRTEPHHVHALVQLDAAADPIRREALVAWGIELERQLARHVWTATVTRLEQPLPEGVRWMGSFRREDRLSAEILRRVEQLAWAPPDEPVVLRVAGHAGCADELENWIGRFGSVLNRPSGADASYRVAVYPHFIGALASGAHVRSVTLAAAQPQDRATREATPPLASGTARVSPHTSRD